MGPEIIEALLISLGLTLLIELVFALLFRVRSMRGLALVALVNLMTNPAVVLLHRLLTDRTALPEVLIIALLEAAAFLIEALYYKYNAEEIFHPFLFSLGANALSFFGGILLSFVF
jgi:hypothetical protein